MLRLPGAAAGLMLALGGCSPYAHIARREGPPIEARIVGSDATHLIVETPDGQRQRVARDEVAEIDHPGNVAMAVGLPNTVVGVLFGVITVFVLVAAETCPAPRAGSTSSWWPPKHASWWPPKHARHLEPAAPRAGSTSSRHLEPAETCQPAETCPAPRAGTWSRLAHGRREFDGLLRDREDGLLNRWAHRAAVELLFARLNVAG